MKIHRIWILLVCFLVLIPALVSASPIVHPSLLFDNIQDTPGYRYNTTNPWKLYQSQLLRTADNSLAYNFSGSLGAHDRIYYRSSYARDFGLAYQITKKSRYAEKAKEALMNIDKGAVPYKMDRTMAIGSYSLAYDFVQPTLDPVNDTLIRDKLATLADSVYKDLNDDGKSKNYVSFADYHGQAYPNMGIAGAALADYTNPNNLPLSSTPEDWHKVGTDYLFVDDKLHSFGRSLFSFGFDEDSGKHLNGAYKSYVLGHFMLWLQVYNHFYDENPFDKYPAAKKAFTAELWDSLPNGYSSNYVTNGNMKWVYHRGFMNLLDDEEKAIALNYDELLEKSTILPYARSLVGGAPAIVLYCVYENYTAIPRAYPDTTSHLDPNSIFQVLRGNWNEDSDWISLVTFNKITRSNRDMMHNDQLSVEYYSRGDLLLADAGENKYVLDKFYGYYDIHHNTIALENPRTPFPVSWWSGGTSQGIYKGSMDTLVTPATVESIVQMPWMQLIQTSVPVTRVIVKQLGSSQSLSSPIHYERTILYPETDYFVIIDRMEGTEPWVYRNIFRPTSLMITPGVDKNKDGNLNASEVGHVNGNLTIGSTPYDWLALPYKKETNTGITTNSFTWTTTNPYGKNVQLNLFSSPASEILIEKNVGRIGGYNAVSEVFSPIVWFRTPQTTAEYRVTALLSSYSDEEAKTAQDIPVTGTGHAMKVHSSNSYDYIYTGSGTSSFAGFTTDADTAFIRQSGGMVEITLLGGSYLDYQNERWVGLSKKADYITLKKEGNMIDYRIQADTDLRGELFNTQVDPLKIQNSTAAREQKNTVITTSYTSTNTGFFSDIVAFIKKIGKQVISFFNIRI